MQVIVNSKRENHTYPIAKYERNVYEDCYIFISLFSIHTHDDVREFSVERHDDEITVTVSVPDYREVDIFNLALKFAALEVADYLAEYGD